MKNGGFLCLTFGRLLRKPAALLWRQFVNVKKWVKNAVFKLTVQDTPRIFKKWAKWFPKSEYMFKSRLFGLIFKMANLWETKIDQMLGHFWLVCRAIKKQRHFFVFFWKVCKIWLFFDKFVKYGFFSLSLVNAVFSTVDRRVEIWSKWVFGCFLSKFVKYVFCLCFLKNKKVCFVVRQLEKYGLFVKVCFCVFYFLGFKSKNR